MTSSVTLADIMDLDYLIHLDQKQDIEHRTLQNRRIYQQYALEDKSDTMVLMTWVKHQRKVFRQTIGHCQADLLPSEILAVIYRWMTILLTGLGFISGAGMVVSFLSYQGDIPVNVTVFILIFMVLPVCILIVTVFWLVLRQWKRLSDMPGQSLIFKGFSWLMFDVLPGVLLKTGRRISGQKTDNAETAMYWFRMKFKEYQSSFFWSFFMLSSLTGLFFAFGLLTGLFFKVLTSDVAFGWQSTLISTATGFYRFVSAAALPWSWLVPESMAHPGLEQIEGTRIILKEGITVLATADLVSWWPFLCFGLICYGMIPRVLLTGAALMKSRRVLNQFDFGRLRYRELMVSMQSPAMNIDTARIPVSGGKPEILSDPAAPAQQHEITASGTRDVSRKTVVMASQRAYSESALDALDAFVTRFIGRPQYLFQYIRFDLQADRDSLNVPAREGIMDGIILHEVWQPPIRGLLHYLDQVQTKIFSGGHLWILLTPDSRDLSVPVEPDDINYQVWKNAVRKLNNPNIDIIRYQP